MLQAFGLLKIAQQALLLHLLPPASDEPAEVDASTADGTVEDSSARRALDHMELQVMLSLSTVMLVSNTSLALADTRETRNCTFSAAAATS